MNETMNPSTAGRDRVRIVFIGMTELLDMLRDVRDKKCVYVLRGGTEIPAGAEVIGFQENWVRRGLDLMIYHPSFSPVRLGEVVPRLDEMPTYRAVRVIVEGDLMRVDPSPDEEAGGTGPVIVKSQP